MGGFDFVKDHSAFLKAINAAVDRTMSEGKTLGVRIRRVRRPEALIEDLRRLTNIEEGLGGYDCCGCSSYNLILDDVLAALREETPWIDRAHEMALVHDRLLSQG